MRIGERWVLPAFFSTCLVFASHCVAQEQPAPQDSAKPSGASEVKKRAKKLRAELSDVDKTWLMEDGREQSGARFGKRALRRFKQLNPRRALHILLTWNNNRCRDEGV